MKRSFAALGLAAATMLIAAVPAPSASLSAAAVPGPQDGLVESLCPRVGPPDDDCYTIGLPGEVWATAAIVPITDDPELVDDAIAAYDSLIPKPFFAIPARRELAVLMFRLDVQMSHDKTIEDDPGEGYAEGSVAIRVGFDGQDGYPYREGWWVLAQPLNDPSQYGAGRDVGLPKYMAESGVRIDEDGTWHARALDWADDGSTEPGRNEVEDGNVLRIDWTPETSEISEEREAASRLWGRYGEALFVQTNPRDEEGPNDPGMVKFTPFSVIPVSGLPETPFTHSPEPHMGTATVTLEGAIPASSWSFADLVGPGPHTVPGTIAFTRGGALLTVDGLDNNRADG